MTSDPNASVFSTLAERLDEGFPRAWTPNRKNADGTQDSPDIQGVYVRTDQAETRGYGSADVLVLAEHPSGELRSVWLLHDAIRDKVKRAELAGGDLIAIRYLGQRESKETGNAYHDYRFAFHRSESPAPVAPVDAATADDSPVFDPTQDDAPAPAQRRGSRGSK